MPLTLYCRRNGRIESEESIDGGGMPEGLIWADAIEPTPEDARSLLRIAGIEIPTPEEMREIEPSSRLYRDGLSLFMTANVLVNADSHEPQTRAVTFVLADGMMATIRYASPAPFRTFQLRIQTQPDLCRTPEQALAELIDAIVDRAADTLEAVDAQVNQVSQAIFGPINAGDSRARDYSEQLKSIGINAVRCSRVDESLVGFQRLLTFYEANLRQSGNKEVRARIKDLHRDIASLMGYAERMSEKLQLLLDATLGLVNIQQNNIIKIFSVIAVVFLPPTLVASIYGMNFHVMPELDWPIGYPFALLLMFLSAFLPYRYFKHRGWL